MEPLRLYRRSFPDDPALDAAVSRALMLRVAAGELPSTLRLATPGPAVAFSKRDVVAPGYPAAIEAARAAGFEPIVRLAGGRAAIFHEGTLELAHAQADEDPRAGIHLRFAAAATLMARALRALGVDAHVGEVPGGVLPGPLQRQCGPRAQAGRPGPACGGGRLAHRRGDRRGRRRAGARRARAGLRGARG